MHLLFDIDGTLAKDFQHVYPGILETLERLMVDGHILHVCTSMRDEHAKHIIAVLGLEKFFQSITGSDDSLYDKTRLIAHILKRETIPASHAVMIGDRGQDMTGAAHNHITAIGALWGHGSGKELMESGANFCARVPHLLPELITSLG